MISFDLDPEGLREMRRAVHRLESALDAAVERAVRATSREVVKEAKRTHGYQDRTGRLTRSIMAYEPIGQFSEDSLEGMVGATMRYASYIEEGTSRGIRAYQYLGGAWIAQRLDTRQRMRDALEDAVRRAGLEP